MSEHLAVVRWRRGDQEFTSGCYSRAHEWEFDGGAVVPASASPHVVRPPQSVESHVDPEEAFVASLSSCHMLFFLSIAAHRGFVVDSYVDRAIGHLKAVAEGELAMTRIRLRPEVAFADGRAPSPEELEALHHEAHERCFLARSVRAEVVVEL